MGDRLERFRRDQEDQPVEGRTSEPRGEPLGPVLLALIVAIALPFGLPSSFPDVASWLMALVEVVLIVAMVALDPGRIDERSIAVRRVRIGLISLLVLRAAIATVVVTADLVDANKAIATSSELFRAGGVVWLGLVISFAFLYWEMDSGGPGIRANFPVPYPDLAFPQQLSPEVAPPGWKPHFGDYLYVGVTTGVAFSPTDAMPLSRWVKLAMGIQSLACLAIVGLVIARAINVVA